MKDAGEHSVAIQGDVAFDEGAWLFLEIRLLAATARS